MGKVLAALEQSRHSHRSCSVNALLESPTGSGKTLALLCATLAWQKQFPALPLLPSAPADPLLAGGGFIVDEPLSGRQLGGEDTPAVKAPIAGRSNTQKSKNRKVPMIYYASRTHTQITQVIRELRKTKYHVSMAVLGARKHYCTNKSVVRKNNVDEDCKLLMKDEERSCPHFKNVMKLKSHPSLQKGGANNIHDIEDLVELGHKVKGCAYFAARALATEADIVFCPYNYILDPIIRSAMEVNLQGAIVVLDEAHNIEDVAREAGSIDLETSLLQDLRLELEQLATSDETSDIYSPLLEMVQAWLDWIYHQEKCLSKLDFEHYASSWRGSKAIQELRLAGTCLETFQVLLECSKKAIGAASNPDETVNHLSGRATIAIEGLFSALKFMLQENGRRAGDYQLVVRRFVKRDEGLAVTGWVTTVSLWCLNPGVVFEDIASVTRSIILTSGTLSPMDSFASELGIPFEFQMEAPHVVDMEKQVWAAAVSTGPDNVSLNASYKNADGYSFQDALGVVLEEVFKVVPDGALTFFPSYKFLDKLCARWKSTGQWGRLSSVKELFLEPRGNNDQFELILQDFYNSINSDRTPGRNRKVGVEKNRDVKTRGTPRSTGRKAGGAAFLAVCRGKVSEGIDFSDRNARIVVVVGIPFPNVKDIQVTLKKQYNQENRVIKKLLSGDEWYCQQTFRALNQAVGRCIRHRNDYGAILLLDDRFKRPGNIQYMSKWLRNSIRQYESFRDSLDGLKEFFKGFESSSDVTQELCIVPTVKSDLVSSRKAKLSIISSTKKPDNQPSLRGYITKARKPSIEVSFEESNARIPTSNEQTNKEDWRKAPEFLAEQISNYSVAQTIQVPVTIESVDPEIAQQNVLASVVSNNVGRDYKIMSSRINTAFKAMENDPEHRGHGNSLGIESGLEILTPIQSSRIDAAAMTSSEKALDLVNCEEIPSADNLFVESSLNCLGQNSVKHSLKRKMDLRNEDISLDMSANSLKGSHSLPQGSPAQLGCRPCEDIKSHYRFQVGGSAGSLDKSIFDRPHGQCICDSHSEGTLACLVESSPCFSKMDLIHACSHEVARQQEVFEAGGKNVKVQCSSPLSAVNKGFQHGERSTEINLRVDSELTASGSGEAQNDLNVAILCGRCFHHLSHYAKVVYETFNKSYLATIHRGDNHRTNIPMLLMEYHNLQASVKEKLYSSSSRGSDSSYDANINVSPNVGVWIREDGCVYEHIFCPSCEDQSICVGVHVVACDKVNLSLMDKVVFFEEYVKVNRMCQKQKMQQSQEHQAQLSTYSNSSENVKTRITTPAKAKLKLQRTKL